MVTFFLFIVGKTNFNEKRDDLWNISKKCAKKKKLRVKCFQVKFYVCSPNFSKIGTKTIVFIQKGLIPLGDLIHSWRNRSNQKWYFSSNFVCFIFYFQERKIKKKLVVSTNKTSVLKTCVCYESLYRAPCNI